MASRKQIKDMAGPKSRREQAAANFRKEEDLAREYRGKLGRDLVLGATERGSDTVKERVISARSFGPALRGERERKKTLAERRRESR
jgi:hypothetical protein